MDLIDVASSHLEWMNWATWLKTQGLNSPQSSRQTIVNTYPLAIQAAVDGLGVALGWQHLVDRYLNSGSLVCPLGEKSLKTSDGYYLLVSEKAKNSEARDIVRNWLLQISKESEKTFSNIKINRPHLKSVS
jgi:DNA-binding transcriptional LysR family regulator